MSSSTSSVWYFLRIIDTESNNVYCCYCEGFQFLWTEKRKSRSNLRNHLLRKHNKNINDILNQKVPIELPESQKNTKKCDSENLNNEYRNLMDKKVADLVTNNGSILQFQI